MSEYIIRNIVSKTIERRERPTEYVFKENITNEIGEEADGVNEVVMIRIIPTRYWTQWREEEDKEREGYKDAR